MNLNVLKVTNLKGDKRFSEKQISELIISNPDALGLGDLDVVGVEVPQTHGFLDLLLSDGEAARYCVEIQLGKTDPSHIIRAIEYWDLQQTRYKGIDHVCVLIAEEITGRFFNVVSLLGNAVPIIAIKLTASESGSGLNILFSKVLDTRREYYGGDEEVQAYVEVDQGYWIEKTSKPSIDLIDRVFQKLSQKISGAELNLAKHYIGAKIDGRSRNFFVFHPRKSTLVLEIKLPQENETEQILEQSKFDYLGYNQRYGAYKIGLKSDDNGSDDALLIDLILQAYELMID